MNILCTFKIMYKESEIDCKLTMLSLVETQKEAKLLGLKELAEALENFNLNVFYILLSKCHRNLKIEQLCEEDLDVVQLTQEFLQGILSLFSKEKKK